MAEKRKALPGRKLNSAKSAVARKDIPASRVSPARAAAYAILERVATTSAHSDDLLHGPGMAPLSQVDRDLAMALVLGVLRWQIALDARIQPLLSRPDAKLALPTVTALRLGAFQLLHMERIPPHAALNESVELVRAAGHEHAAGMVNAILRKLATSPPVRKPLIETTAALAQRLSHPQWIVDRWVRQYGRPATEAICLFDQQEPAPADIFASLPEMEGMPVMDAGSRLVAELAATAGQAARRVWDCCAAPGGKTLVLAKRLPGAELLATDASPVRSRRLADRLARAHVGENVRVQHQDATTLPPGEGTFDLILCDVPCSGTGTLARNPEIRSRLQLEDLSRQAARQRQLLGTALQRLSPGGTLIYSTCSLEREECEGVVEAVLADAAGPGIQLKSVSEPLHHLQAIGLLTTIGTSWTRGPYLRTLPGAGFPGDGFFAAILERGR